VSDSPAELDTNIDYNLSQRHHGKTLILKTAEVNEIDLLIRNLYKRIY